VILMRTQRRPAGFLVAMATAVLAVITAAVPAAAHAEFESSTPAPDSTVKELPRTVTLTFSEPVRTPAFVEVTAPSGDNIATGDVRVRDADLIQRIRHSTEAGQYALSYRVTSDDGHPVSGTVRFRLAVGAGETAAEEGASQPAPPPPAQSEPTESGDTGLGTGQLVVLLVALALAVGALVVGTRRALAHSATMVEGGKKSGRSRRT
jgi:methionine-rich copper-binding protein CopC